MPELKATADHLRRDASGRSLNTARAGQYALRDQVMAAGWPIERIHVIDRDLGKSGSSAAARDGFQQFVSEVALGKAGTTKRHIPGGHPQACQSSSILLRQHDGDHPLGDSGIGGIG